MRITTALAAALAALLLCAAGAQAQYFQDFESLGYDFYADPGCSSGVQGAVVHGGAQAAQFTLDSTNQAYTRWKSEDLTSYGISLADVVASNWEMRSSGRSDLAPYLLFTVATPDTGQETLVIQFAMPAIPDSTWTLNAVDRNTTTFHVVGDRTGLGATEFSSSGTQGTLNDLSAKTYSGAIKWGDFAVTHVRIGAGLWDAAQAWNGYADDLSVGVVPEPASLGLLVAAGSLLGLRRKR